MRGKASGPLEQLRAIGSLSRRRSGERRKGALRSQHLAPAAAAAASIDATRNNDGSRLRGQRTAAVVRRHALDAVRPIPMGEYL